MYLILPKMNISICIRIFFFWKAGIGEVSQWLRTLGLPETRIWFSEPILHGS